MERSRVFRSKKSQAVRLPKAVQLPASVKQVDIVKLGQARIIAPAGQSWDVWFDGPSVSADFMNNRVQGSDQERDEL